MINYPNQLKYAAYLARIKRPEVRNYRMASILVYDKREFIDYPRNKTHPTQKLYAKNEDSLFAHAEVGSVIQAKRFYRNDIDWSKSILYIARVKAISSVCPDTFMPGLARPCEGCQRMIDKLGIKTVYYTLNEDGYERTTKALG